MAFGKAALPGRQIKVGWFTLASLLILGAAIALDFPAAWVQSGPFATATRDQP
jgi:hypothetical protein